MSNEVSTSAVSLSSQTVSDAKTTPISNNNMPTKETKSSADSGKETAIQSQANQLSTLSDSVPPTTSIHESVATSNDGNVLSSISIDVSPLSVSDNNIIVADITSSPVTAAAPTEQSLASIISSSSSFSFSTTQQFSVSPSPVNKNSSPVYESLPKVTPSPQQSSATIAVNADPILENAHDNTAIGNSNSINNPFYIPTEILIDAPTTPFFFLPSSTLGAKEKEQEETSSGSDTATIITHSIKFEKPSQTARKTRSKNGAGQERYDSMNGNGLIMGLLVFLFF